MKKKNKTVVLGISGGIDSAVAAVLLKKRGFSLLAVFLYLAETKHFREGEKKAREIAAFLNIPLQILDLRKQFKREIILPFLKDYKKGITPNPCVFCNEKIKIKWLREEARKRGYSFVATGHYARVRKKGEEYWLLRAKDKEKDQSYFLWRLKERELPYILFPLGELKKEEVKLIAQKEKLPLGNISESMELCFVPRDIKEFLLKEIGSREGEILNEKGEVVGKHNGIWFYTVGQRKRIRLPSGPFYVFGKNTRGNKVFVTKNKRKLLQKKLLFHKVNWISLQQPSFPFRAMAKVRYRGNSQRGTVFFSGSDYSFEFDRLQESITPGQSIVFFQRERVLGGGVIKKVLG